MRFGVRVFEHKLSDALPGRERRNCPFDFEIIYGSRVAKVI